MVQLDDTFALAADVITRLSLMSLLPPREVKIKQPYSDPSHLSSRQRQALRKQVGKDSGLLPAARVTEHGARVTSRVTSRVTKRTEPDQTKTEDNSSFLVNVRLSFPVERSTGRQLPRSYALYRPLTPILRVHSARHPAARPVALPVQVDFLKELPVDITILLLQNYISPCVLLSVRAVCRYYHMLCDLRLVKHRWKDYLTVQKLNRLNRGEENCIVTPLPVPARRMSRSRGVLSPIQLAPSSHRWNTPPKPSPSRPDLYPKPQLLASRSNPPPSPLATHVVPHPSPQTPALYSSIHAVPRPSPQTPALHNSTQAAPRPSPQTPALHSSIHAVPRPSPQTPALHSSNHAAPRPVPRTPALCSSLRHPPKRPPSGRDIKSDDCLPTPEKVTRVDGKKKRGNVSRTPFRTLNMGTPNSTSSSKTSLSSTTSLLTPTTSLLTPDIVRPGPTPLTEPEFKVPSYSINSKSRQRLKRL